MISRTAAMLDRWSNVLHSFKHTLSLWPNSSVCVLSLKFRPSWMPHGGIWLFLHKLELLLCFSSMQNTCDLWPLYTKWKKQKKECFLFSLCRFSFSATGPTPTATLPLPPPPAVPTCATATTLRDAERRSSPAPPPRATPATSTTTQSLSRHRRRPAASTCLRRRTVRAARRRLTPSAATPITSIRRHRRPARTPHEPNPLWSPTPSSQLHPLTVNSNCAYMR